MPSGDLENATAVSVLFEDGGMADIYSTAVYLMGYTEGLAFVEATEGLEAIWYLPDGSVEYSSGFNTYIYQLSE
jgi:thiamine biosynthesis lipoprotein